MPSSPPDVVVAHARTSNHRQQIEASTVCGCFHCLTTFAPSEVTQWIDTPVDAPDGTEPAAGTTALCPRCGVDAVLGSASGYPIDATFLSAMRRYWFS